MDFNDYLAFKTDEFGEITIDDMVFTPVWDPSPDCEEHIVLHYELGPLKKEVSISKVHAFVYLYKKYKEEYENNEIAADFLFSEMRTVDEYMEAYLHGANIPSDTDSYGRPCPANRFISIDWEAIFREEVANGCFEYVVMDSDNNPTELTIESSYEDDEVFILQGPF